MIKLRPMTIEEFKAYLLHNIAEYAAEKVKAGNWAEEGSLELAQKEFDGYLPQGLDTPGQTLQTICDAETGEAVGTIWYGFTPDRKESLWFIYDFLVDESMRGHGYGSAALAELESLAKQEGISTIRLHVFGHNTGALRLYEKAGYVVTNIQMMRRVGSEKGTAVD